MATTNTITLELIDELNDVLIKLDYTHAIAGLIIEQKDYISLPSHQQIALQALTGFTHDARQKLVVILEREA